LEIITELREPSFDVPDRVEGNLINHLESCYAIANCCGELIFGCGCVAIICEDVAECCGRVAGDCEWVVDKCGGVIDKRESIIGRCDRVVESCRRLADECEGIIGRCGGRRGRFIKKFFSINSIINL
jgi:hypothetical protein